MEESIVEEPPFSPEVQQAVEGLLYLGHLERDVQFAGHTFGLRTLTVAEEIAAGVVVKPFKDTLREPQAWASAQVALALTHVDNDTEFCPQAGPDQAAYAKARLNYITANWYWPTIDVLFQEYTKLLQEQIEIIRSVQSLSAEALPISMASVDALIGQATSNAETPTETPS